MGRGRPRPVGLSGPVGSQRVVQIRISLSLVIPDALDLCHGRFLLPAVLVSHTGAASFA